MATKKRPPSTEVPKKMATKKRPPSKEIPKIAVKAARPRSFVHDKVPAKLAENAAKAVVIAAPPTVAASANSGFKRLGVLIREAGAGRAADRIPVIASAEYGSGAKWPIGVLASDHVGYLSFDLSRVPMSNPSAPDDLIAHIWVQPLGTTLVVDALASSPAADSILVVLEITSGQLATTGKAALPSMQSPSIEDWRLSPGSFSINADLFVGQDGCEQLYPANLATQEFHFWQVLRLTDPQSIISVDAGDDQLFGGVVRIGLLLDYQTTWYPLGHMLGDIAYSLPLAPCESVNITMIDWSRKDEASRLDDISEKEQLLHNQRRDRTITEAVQGAVDEWQRGGSVMGGVGGSVGTAIDKTGIGANAALGGAYSTSSGTRNVAANTVQQLSDNFAQATNVLRELHSTVIVQSAQAEQEVIQTRTVTNHNHSHALTVLYYEVMRYFRVVTQLARTPSSPSGWRPALLVRYQPINFDVDAVRRYRPILEQVLLDGRFKDCFDPLDGLPASEKSDLTYRMLRMEVRIADVDPQSSSGTEASLELLLNDGDFEMLECHDAEPGQDPKLIVRPAIFEERNVTYIFHMARKGNQDIQRGDYIGVRLQCFGFATSPTDHTNHIRLAGFKLIGITDVGETTALIDNSDFVYMAKDTIPGSSSWATTYQIYPITEPNNAWIRLKPEDRACIERLVSHVDENQVYYSRAIWLAEDPGTRAARFDAVSLTPLGMPGMSLLDLVQNRPLDVLGLDVAFPMENSVFQSLLSEGIRELSFAPDPPVERLVAVPARGVFAEAKLSHCNASEEIDVTRFWDWQQSPCPEKAPEIAPATPVTPQPQPTGTTPLSLPSPVVSIVTPPAAPDPTGMTAVLGLLGKSGIFSDMSGQKAVSDLLQKLASGSISLADAQKQAQQLQASGATTTSGSASGGTPRLSPQDQHNQLQVLRNAEMRGDITPNQRQQFANQLFQNALATDTAAVPVATVIPVATVRKSHLSLQASDWKDFKDAITRMKKTARGAGPATLYDRYVLNHAQTMLGATINSAGRSWGAHYMQSPAQGPGQDGKPMSDGRNFLSWHREFLLQFESELGVPIPFWDWAKDSKLPDEMTDPADLTGNWADLSGPVSRVLQPNQMMTPQLPLGDIAHLMLTPDFSDVSSLVGGGMSGFPVSPTGFQPDLELKFHNAVHRIIGGDMADPSTAVRDPIFWMHHAFVDKLWAEWQLNRGLAASAGPSNMSEALQPSPPFGHTVAQVMNIYSLGYTYEGLPLPVVSGGSGGSVTV